MFYVKPLLCIYSSFLTKEKYTTLILFKNSLNKSLIINRIFLYCSICFFLKKYVATYTFSHSSLILHYHKRLYSYMYKISLKKYCILRFLANFIHFSVFFSYLKKHCLAHNSVNLSRIGLKIFSET